MSVSSLKVNHMCEPSGVVDAQPVLSWIVESPDRNVMQQAYEVRVFRDGRSVWRTGRVESQNSVTVAYEGEPLASGTRYEWQVRVWDNRGRVSKWSERSSWLTGMMTPDEWQAEWILPAEQTDADREAYIDQAKYVAKFDKMVKDGKIGRVGILSKEQTRAINDVQAEAVEIQPQADAEDYSTYLDTKQFEAEAIARV